MSYFVRKHHRAVAEVIGSMSRTIPDEYIQTMTEEFGKMFDKDNPLFNFTEFQSYVTRITEGKY